MTSPVIDDSSLANLSVTQSFLRALDARGVFTFQTFDDNKERKSATLVRVLHGTLDQHATTLSALNQKGAGIFIMVSEGDLKGRKAENVQKVRAVFVDLDGAPLPPVQNWLLPPHIIVNTSPGRHHAYWKVSDCALQKFKPLQQALLAKFGGDPNVHDLPRVMRLPGFYHCKEEPTLATVRSIDTHAPYTVAQLTQALALNSTAQSINDAAMGGIHIPSNAYEVCLEGCRNVTLAKLAGRWIAEGKEYAELIAKASDWNQRCCKPPLDDSEVRAVCTSIWQKHYRERAQPNHGPASAPADTSAWEEPIPFTEYATPEIPASLLPGEFGDFAKALATATETPEAMAVFTVLGTLSAALAKRFAIRPRSGWLEPINIYTLVALPPANNKSLVLNRCTAPLSDWEIQQKTLLEPELKRQRSERKNQERLIESMRAKAGRDQDPNKRAALFHEICELESKLPNIKSLPQIFANDATPESLAQNVHEQGGRFAIISDEGGITETLSGLYTGGTANVDLILKGIDGGDLRVRRKDRSFDLKPYLTFMLVVQPRIVQNMGERRAFRGNCVFRSIVTAVSGRT